MNTYESSLFIGKTIHAFDQIDSTNQCAIELLSKSNPSEGTAITARFQSQGRGQIGRYWHSAAGQNLTTSIILYPNFLNPNEQFHLNMFVSLAVQAFFSRYIEEKVYVKWPNDIYVGDRKIGGILIQNSIQGSRISWTVVGLGLNINETTFPKSLPNPTSLSLETKEVYELNKLQQELFSVFEQHFLNFKSSKRIPKEKYEVLLWGRNQTRNFLLEDGTKCSGTILGVTDAGKLEVEIDQEIKQFAFREISIDRL